VTKTTIADRFTASKSEPPAARAAAAGQAAAAPPARAGQAAEPTAPDAATSIAALGTASVTPAVIGWKCVTHTQEPEMAINHYTQNLYGREVDGWYWVLLEEGFEDCARRYHLEGDEHAASIADRLAKTADDVPAQLMQEFQEVWDVVADYPDGQSPADLTNDEMERAIAHGYSPDNATLYVLEFIRRMTGARAQ
jgi:hypothetical protein